MSKKPDVSFDARVKLAKTQILNDVAAGVIPRTVKSFSELHDYVDANDYADFTVDGVFDAMKDKYGPDDAPDEGFVGFMNKVQTAVDEWIKSGELAKAAKWTDKGRTRRMLEALIRGDEAAAAAELAPVLTARMAKVINRGS